MGRVRLVVAVKDVGWAADRDKGEVKVAVRARARVAAGWAVRSQRVRAACAYVRNAGTRRRTWRVSRAAGRCARSAAVRWRGRDGWATAARLEAGSRDWENGIDRLDGKGENQGLLPQMVLRG